MRGCIHPPTAFGCGGQLVNGELMGFYLPGWVLWLLGLWKLAGVRNGETWKMGMQSLMACLIFAAPFFCYLRAESLVVSPSNWWGMGGPVIGGLAYLLGTGTAWAAGGYFALPLCICGCLRLVPHADLSGK